MTDQSNKMFLSWGALFGFALGVILIFSDYSKKFFNSSVISAPKVLVEKKVPSPTVALSSLTYFDVLYSPPEQYSVETTESDDAVKWVNLVEKPTRSTIAEAIARVLGNETPEAVKDSSAGVALSTGSPFAVQISSFPTHQAAVDESKIWTAKGYDVRVVRGELGDQQVVFRVRIHGFSTVEDAEAAKDKFEQSENRKALVIAQN